MASSIFYRVMSCYDQLWRRFHQVEKVDELVSLSYEPYQGKRRQLNDGTLLEPGDPLAILHFNRECFAQEDNSARASLRAALRFRRLLFASFEHLAARLETNEKLRDVKAFYGVTWFPPHGEKVGFIIERLPDSLRNRFRRFYFRLLLKAFFPALAVRENERLQPHGFWLTRNHLLNSFSEESCNDESRVDKARGRDPQGTHSHGGESFGFADSPSSP